MELISVKPNAKTLPNDIQKACFVLFVLRLTSTYYDLNKLITNYFINSIILSHAKPSPYGLLALAMES